MTRLKATVDSKGQAIIPKPIRDEMGIRPGDKVHFRIEGGRVLLETDGGEAVLEAFLSAYEKRPLPENPGWDRSMGRDRHP